MQFLNNNKKGEFDELIESLKEEGVIETKAAYDIYGKPLPNRIAIYCENNASLYVLNKFYPKTFPLKG